MINFTHRRPQSEHFFLQIRVLFSNFWKRAGETSPLSPSSSYAPGRQERKVKAKCSNIFVQMSTNNVWDLCSNRDQKINIFCMLKSFATLVFLQKFCYITKVLLHWIYSEISDKRAPANNGQKLEERTKLVQIPYKENL